MKFFGASHFLRYQREAQDAVDNAVQSLQLSLQVDSADTDREILSECRRIGSLEGNVSGMMAAQIQSCEEQRKTTGEVRVLGEAVRRVAAAQVQQLDALTARLSRQLQGFAEALSEQLAAMEERVSARLDELEAAAARTVVDVIRATHLLLISSDMDWLVDTMR